jgi:hypothetical protein
VEVGNVYSFISIAMETQRLLTNASSVLNYKHCPKIPLFTLYPAVIVVVRTFVSILGTLRKRG